MPDVRYVVLSDLHFGAENSVLSRVDAVHHDVVDPTRPGAGMEALVRCLHDLVAHNEGERQPTLILGGDMLEFALATDNVAAMVFDRFVERTLAGSNRLFDSRIYFVPGNHDHHIWEGTREQHYAEYAASVPATEPLKAPRHTTPMFAVGDEQPTRSYLITALVQRAGDEDLRVQTVYPNLALLSPDGRKGFVFHHGHYVEPMYRLMSSMSQLVFNRPPEPDIVQWEAENFAWIDFFWSSLGRSGAVGRDVALIYESLASQQATDRIVDHLAAHVANSLHTGRVRRFVARRVVRGALHHAVSKVALRERRHTAGHLSDDAQRGLREYVEGPLRNQLATECNGDPPSEVLFAFGHTHKPFVDRLDASRYPVPVQIMNTGGWVVDGLHPEPFHGAAAVLLDEDLNAVLLRFYTQHERPSDYRAEVVTPVGVPESEFARRLRTIVETNRRPWMDLSATMAEVVAERNAALAELIAGRPTTGP